MEKEIQKLELYLEWYLNIPNEYNRRKLVSDKDLVAMIGRKLSIMEEEYEKETYEQTYIM